MLCAFHAKLPKKLLPHGEENMHLWWRCSFCNFISMRCVCDD